MAITFPRTFPSDFDFSASVFGLDRMQSVFEASTSRQTLVQNFNAGKNDIWTGMLTCQRLDQAGVAKLTAWLLSLKGRQGTFYINDPDRPYPNGSVDYGNGTVTCDSTTITCDSTTITSDNGDNIIEVNGASQTGSSLVVTMDASQTGVFLAGDYIQVEAGYYMIMEDVSSDGSGNATIEIEPVMRSSPADGATVIYQNPKLTARLAEPFKPWDTDYHKTGVIAFAFEEIV